MELGAVIVGHTTVPPNTDWLRGEIPRVLHKLDLSWVGIALEPGTTLLAAEAALATGIEVVLHPLVPVDRLADTYAGYPDVNPRLAAILANPGTTVAQVATANVSRAARRRRSDELVDAYDVHIAIYDGRDRGSVLDHLQPIMGVHDLYVVNPVRQLTTAHRAPTAATRLTVVPDAPLTDAG